MIIINPEIADKIIKENSFELFKHKGLLCCIQRMMKDGTLSGYVAINKGHPLFGENYYSAPITAHEEITYSDRGLSGIDDKLFGDLWWFGFATSHVSDFKPFQDEINGGYSLEGEYRDFEYVKNETIKLAEQLISFK